MTFLQRLFGKRETLDPEALAREGERLDGKRRHLRGKLSQNQGLIRRLWTAYRTGPAEDKPALKAKIRRAEAERKALVKEMLALEAQMKKLGYQRKAGYVDAH